MRPDVLALGDFPPGMMAALAARFTVHHFVPYPLPDGALAPDVAARIRAVATEANRGASRELIARLPRLEIIACFGVGTDRVDLAAARERGIAVTNTPGVMADDVADLAIGLMLASARGIVAAERFVRDGQWTKGPIGLARTVTGRRLGVLGLGAIGRAIADRAAAFKMAVRYCGPRRKPDAPYEFVGDPVALARDSDFLMIACKGGPETQHLVSAEVIARREVRHADQCLARLGGGRGGADRGVARRPARRRGARRVRDRTAGVARAPGAAQRHRAAAPRRRDSGDRGGDRPPGARQHRGQARRRPLPTPVI